MLSPLMIEYLIRSGQIDVLFDGGPHEKAIASSRAIDEAVYEQSYAHQARYGPARRTPRGLHEVPLDLERGLIGDAALLPTPPITAAPGASFDGVAADPQPDTLSDGAANDKADTSLPANDKPSGSSGRGVQRRHNSHHEDHTGREAPPTTNKSYTPPVGHIDGSNDDDDAIDNTNDSLFFDEAFSCIHGDNTLVAPPDFESTPRKTVIAPQPINRVPVQASLNLSEQEFIDLDDYEGDYDEVNTKNSVFNFITIINHDEQDDWVAYNAEATQNSAENTFFTPADPHNHNKQSMIEFGADQSGPSQPVTENTYTGQNHANVLPHQHANIIETRGSQSHSINNGYILGGHQGRRTTNPQSNRRGQRQADRAAVQTGFLSLPHDMAISEGSQHQVPAEFQIANIDTIQLSWYSKEDAAAARTSEVLEDDGMDLSKPRSPVEERVWVKIIIHAMKSMELAEDNEKMKESWAKIINEDPQTVEAAAWELLERIMDYHNRVGLLREKASYASKVPKRVTFRETMDIILPGLKVQKTLCKRLTGDDYLSSFIDNTHASIKRVVGNRGVNLKKKENTEQGRRAKQLIDSLESHVSSISPEAMVAPPLPTPKVSRKRRTDSNIGGPPVQRARTSRDSSTISRDGDVAIMQRPATLRARGNAAAAQSPNSFSASGAMDSLFGLANNEDATGTTSRNEMNGLASRGGNYIDPNLVAASTDGTTEIHNQRMATQKEIREFLIRQYDGTWESYVPHSYIHTNGMQGPNVPGYEMPASHPYAEPNLALDERVIEY